MTWVSAVIPTYNRPEFLHGAIESVLDQDYDDLELVVVDDSSDTDYATNIAAEYPDTVRCVAHDENRGLSAARNTGIETANGDYLAFLDDDDRWTPAKLDKQVTALEANPNAGLATCPVVAVTPDGDLVRCEGTKPDGDLSTDILRRNVIGSPSRVLARASALEDVGTFDESLPTKQDWDLYIRLCQSYDVVCPDEYLCYRTIHDSMSSDPADERENNMRVIEKHESLIRECGVYDQTMGAYHATVGRTFLEDGDTRTARKEFWQALSFDFRKRYLLLYLFSLAGVGPARAAIGLKRLLERRRNCAGVSVPGSLG